MFISFTIFCLYNVFIYAVLFISFLHCTLSVSGKWKYFISANYFFNPHEAVRKRDE